MSRSKNINAAAKARSEERKTNTRNRIALSLLQHRFGASSAMNAYKVEAAEIQARHKIETSTLAQRHATERANLIRKHKVERQAHTTKATRAKKLQDAHAAMLTRTMNKLRKV